MPISVEMFAVDGPETRTAIENVLRDVIGPMSGEWRVSIIGSQQNDVWELKIRGPNTNRRYELHGTDGQTDPRFIRTLLTDTLAVPSAPSASLAAPVIGAWVRLSNGSGTASDVRKTLQFITENWFKASDDFAVTQKWGGLPPDKETQFRAAFEKEVRHHAREFAQLVQSVSQGPVALEFFSTLGELPTTLKEIAYVKGFRAASDENRVLILSALSREPQNFIESCVKEFPSDLLVDAFQSFLRSRNSAFKLSSQGLPDLSGLSHVDLLFGISSLRVPDQNRYIGELSTELRSALNGIAGRLIRVLPAESFGRFARLRLSVFICLAATNPKDADVAKLILRSERDPLVLSVLMLTDGLPFLQQMFKQLDVPTGQQQPAYTVALIDLLRVNAPKFLAEATNKLESWSKSKSAVLAVASQAALQGLPGATARDFEKVFLKAARSDERSEVAQWLANNSDFIKGINLTRLPRTLWKLLLSSFVPIEPQLARLLIQSKLKISPFERYWQDSIEILAERNSLESEHLLTELILPELQHDLTSEKKRTLSTEPARSFIHRRYWTLATSLREESRLRLFDLIRKKVTPADALQLLHYGMSSVDLHVASGLRAWITSAFVPYLLRIGALHPDFARTIGDSSFKEVLAKQLAVAVVADCRYLEEFPTTWKSKRDDTKSIILSRLQGGLQAAFLNTRRDSPLYTNLERLSGCLAEWTQKDTPLLESGFKLAFPSDYPAASGEDSGVLEDYFRRQPKHPHELALFLGSNPWSFEYLFREQRSWPSQDVLLESICKSFTFIANLRVRASEMTEAINQSVVLDMGIAIRNVLADIEAELAGYFIFRDVLEEIGLKPVAPRLGTVFQEQNASSELHRIVREAGRPGRLRVFSSGVAAGDKVIDTATIAQSGAKDDSD